MAYPQPRRVQKNAYNFSLQSVIQQIFSILLLDIFVHRRKLNPGVCHET